MVIQLKGVPCGRSISAPYVLRPLLSLMDLSNGDKVFYTRSTGLRVPMKVGDHLNDRHVELEYYRDGVGGTVHALSNCLLACGIGACLGTFGVAAPMSCTSPSVFYCIFLNFAFGGRSAILLMDHGTMFRLMFGWRRATRPPQRMRERMR